MVVLEWWGLLRSLALYWRPGRQRGLRAFYSAFVGPGDLVFDVGAHLGDRTAAFAALGARVIALEPQPRLIPWLRRLAGRSEGVTIVPAAVGRMEGSEEIAVSKRTPTVSSLSETWRGSVTKANPGFEDVRWEERVRVPVTTLDALIAEHGVPRFCKIDVEGYEAEVLAGLTHPLDALSVEFVSGTLGITEACLERLDELDGYEYNVVIGEGREFTFESWMDAGGIREWLSAGAGGASSGDLYARRVTALGHERGDAP